MLIQCLVKFIIHKYIVTKMKNYTKIIQKLYKEIRFYNTTNNYTYT